MLLLPLLMHLRQPTVVADTLAAVTAVRCIARRRHRQQQRAVSTVNPPDVAPVAFYTTCLRAPFIYGWCGSVHRLRSYLPSRVQSRRPRQRIRRPPVLYTAAAAMPRCSVVRCVRSRCRRPAGRRITFMISHLRTRQEHSPPMCWSRGDQIVTVSVRFTTVCSSMFATAPGLYRALVDAV